MGHGRLLRWWRPLLAHYLGVFLVFVISMAGAWALLDWIGAFPEDPDA